MQTNFNKTFPTSDLYVSSHGFSEHTPTPICSPYRYQLCRPSATIVPDESRNQAITADETP